MKAAQQPDGTQRREPTMPQLLDVGFRLMGFQLTPKMTDLIYETVTLLNKKKGRMDLRDTATLQAANEDKYPRHRNKYLHLKGKRYKPSTFYK